MSALRAWLGGLLVAALVGCTSETEPTPPSKNGCSDPLALLLPDGNCIRPGIPLDGCALGFEHDGEYGCRAILPSDPCPAGLMAVPGETECRPVMPCEDGTWGNIPSEPSTQYVDASYLGGSSNGSQATPWTTIADAVGAAADGAIIAVAAGNYAENVFIDNKPLRVMGVCPERVAIVASATPNGNCPPAAMCILGAGATGSEIRGVSLTGAGNGVVLSAARDVMLDHVWVHDNGIWGLDAENALGRPSVIVRDSLIEQNRASGIVLAGADGVIEASVVRANLPKASDLTAGRGIAVQTSCSPTTTLACDPSTRSTAIVSGSLIEQNHEIGINVSSSELLLEASVVRATQPSAADASLGRGLGVRSLCVETPTSLSCDPALRASATVTGSVIEQSYDTGVLIRGADATLETSVVRGTLPNASGQLFGRGIDVMSSCVEGATDVLCDLSGRSGVYIDRSLIEQNHDLGVAIMGSDATVETSVVRDTMPRGVDQAYGRGIGASLTCWLSPAGIRCNPDTRSLAVIHGSLVDRNHDVGVMAVGSEVMLEASMVRATAANAADGSLGDGVAVVGDGPASATVRGVFIDQSARAGVTSFGAAASISGSLIRCAAFPLDGESYADVGPAFEDLGGNSCGCPDAADACQVVSSGLAPPAPLGAND